MTTILMILFFTLGFTSSLLISYIAKRVKSKKESIYTRKGLFKSTYLQNGKDFDIEVEVGEIERTKTKSKIVITGSIKSTTYLTTSTKNQLKPMIEGWIDSNSSGIEWFEKHPSDIRASKIDDVLK